MDSEVRTPGPSLSTSKPLVAILPRSPAPILPPHDLDELRETLLTTDVVKWAIAAEIGHITVNYAAAHLPSTQAHLPIYPAS
jgi:hypothetical protein